MRDPPSTELPRETRYDRFINAKFEIKHTHRLTTSRHVHMCTPNIIAKYRERRGACSFVSRLAAHEHPNPYGVYPRIDIIYEKVDARVPADSAGGRPLNRASGEVALELQDHIALTKAASTQ